MSPLARNPRPPFAPCPCKRAHHAPLGRPDSLHRKNAPHLPLVYPGGASSQQTRDAPRRLQWPRCRPLRLPRQMGRPSPPRPPSPPSLALINSFRRALAERRNSSSVSILSLGIEWFSETLPARDERARNGQTMRIALFALLLVFSARPLLAQ